MGYQPSEPILVPPLYSWPAHPVAAFRWLIFEMLFPWGLCWIAPAFISMELPDSLRADDGGTGTWLDWDDLAPKRGSSATGCRRSALVVVFKAFSKAGFQVQHTLAIRRESKVSLEESSQGQHVLEPDQWLYNLDTLRVPDSLVSDICSSDSAGVGALTGLSYSDAL